LVCENIEHVTNIEVINLKKIIEVNVDITSINAV
jgi:hypothetical protein